jgi:D-aminopeptidase
MTITEARTALGDALEDGGVDVAYAVGTRQPPVALVFGDGMDDLGHLVRGTLTARFRITLVAGLADRTATADALDALKLAALTAIRTLPTFRLDEVRRDATVRLTGGAYLAADVVASTPIDL